MIIYNPQNWYWIKGGERIYSSGKNTFIDPSNTDYCAWQSSGGVATNWPRDAEGEESDVELAAVLAPFGIFPAFDIETVKANKIAAIDAKTKSLIMSHGFEFRGESFSMSSDAQNNWQTIMNTMNMFKRKIANGELPEQVLSVMFPYEISTVDNKAFQLHSESEVDEFYLAYTQYQSDASSPLAQGRAMRKLVTAAESIEEVEAIVDDRE